MSTLSSGNAAEVGLCAERIELARQLGARRVDEGATPSIIMLVARHGKIVLQEAFGSLVPGPDAPPLANDSIFTIASISKPITATAAMILVEDGLLGLNKPVRDYLPEISGEGTEDILVHHLFTHTSGYDEEEIAPLVESRWAAAEVVAAESTQHPRMQKLLSALWDAPLWKPPGELMNYCNHNYVLLGEIIRRLSGQALDDFARQRIFEPLGMNDSSYVVPEVLEPRVVRFPDDAMLTQQASESVFFDLINHREAWQWPLPGGGVHSTAIDLAVFGQTMLNGGRYGEARILSPHTVAAMTRDHLRGMGCKFGPWILKENRWGLGWWVAGYEKWKYFTSALLPPNAFGHPGAGCSSLTVVPEQDLVMVFFEVVMRATPDFEPIWELEEFQNVVLSAIRD